MRYCAALLQPISENLYQQVPLGRFRYEDMTELFFSSSPQIFPPGTPQSGSGQPEAAAETVPGGGS